MTQKITMNQSLRNDLQNTSVKVGDVTLNPYDSNSGYKVDPGYGLRAPMGSTSGSTTKEDPFKKNFGMTYDSLKKRGVGLSGAKLVGVSSDFAAQFSKAMDDYCQNVRKCITKLQLKNNADIAFKGDVAKQVDYLVDYIGKIAISYLDKLKDAEIQVVNSVANAYKEIDASAATQVAKSRETIVSSNLTTNKSTSK